MPHDPKTYPFYCMVSIIGLVVLGWLMSIGMTAAGALFLFVGIIIGIALIGAAIDKKRRDRADELIGRAFLSGICPFCGAKLLEGLASCPSCNRQLPYTYASSTPSVNCPSCGQAIDPADVNICRRCNVKFCRGCGAVTGDVSATRCVRCRHFI